MYKSYFPYKTLLWVTIFAIAMGFLETAVVVYMRELLYPNGFAFPLAQIPEKLAITELFREVATIIMLAGIGTLASKLFTKRFAWFLYAFAIWDIFYYIFLKLLLNWPESWFTWDILFLIPVTWVGPVIAPVIVSLTMILLALLLISHNPFHKRKLIKRREWILLITGSIVLIISFVWDYSCFILEHYSFRSIWSVPTEEILKLSLQYIPHQFNWYLFWFGELIIFWAIFHYWRRKRQLVVK